jgi:hypothetical protein
MCATGVGGLPELPKSPELPKLKSCANEIARRQQGKTHRTPDFQFWQLPILAILAI